MKDQPTEPDNNVPEAAAPVAPVVPEYVAPAAPVAPEPVQQWQQAPPVQAQVQYVVAQKSLDGIGGWLAFWLVVFSLSGLGYISMFFTTLTGGISTPADTILVLFSPVLAVGYIASVTLIALRKKLGMWVSMATIGVATLYTVVNTIIASTGSYSGADVGSAIGGVVVSIVFGGLIALYFFSSKRVKATLVN